MNGTAVILSMGLAVSGAAGVRSDPGSSGVGQERGVVTRIEATREVDLVLDKVRAALGGRERLASVRSLLVEGLRIPQGRAPDPFTVRILLPNRYQQVGLRNTFTVDDADYWQVPQPNEEVRKEARNRMIGWFAEYCAVLLMRAPAQMPLKAELAQGRQASEMAILFHGRDGFTRRMELDSRTMRPRGFTDSASTTLDARPPLGSRRVVFTEFTQVSGVWFPTRMTEDMGRSPVIIEFSSIRVNEGVSGTDFVRR